VFGGEVERVQFGPECGTRKVRGQSRAGDAERRLEGARVPRNCDCHDVWPPFPQVSKASTATPGPES
jgi:hypothetical protein